MARRSSDTIFHIVNYNIRNVLQDGLTKIQELRQYDNISDQILVFLRYLSFFVEHTIERIHSSAKTEEKRQLHYHKLWHENSRIQKQISVLSKILEDRRSIHRYINGRISSQHLKNIGLIKKLEEKCSADAKSLSMKFERIQIDEYKQSKARQNDLNQIVSITQIKTLNLARTNERLGREIYSKKFRVMSQYLSLMSRYDTEIGERHTAIAHLKFNFDALNEKRLKLEDAIEKQEDVFSSYIYALRATEIKEFVDRVKLSRIMNATKTIQQWWRSIIDERKLMKKRKGKEKGTLRKNDKFSP